MVTTTARQTAPVSQPTARFDRAAAASGYSHAATIVMFDAIDPQGLTVDEATDWLEADITPWGAPTWIAEGFSDPEEASEYRRWRLSASDARWARQDGIDESGLRTYRRLFEMMATVPTAPGLVGAGITPLL